MKKIILALSVPALMMTACGDSTKTEETTVTATPAIEPAAPEAATATDAKEVTIQIESDDQMKYNLSEIKVKEGQKVTVELKHTGTMKKEAMGHNFVLLAQGVDMAKFAEAATKAKDTDYIPAGSKDVLAHTKMIGGGETTSVTFDAPAKGTYDFMCSFPGHYAVMKGKFIVE